MSEYPQISNDPEVQMFYEKMRANGQTHRFAEMVAFRHAPSMTGSDRAFLQDKHQSQGLDHIFADQYLERAAKSGICTTGKVYISQLADKRGPSDPLAWVSNRDEALSVAKSRGHGVHGTKIKAVERPPQKQIRLANDLVQEEMAQEIRKDPDKAQKLNELRHEVIEKHGVRAKDGFNTFKSDE